jgi:hypothetical protein
MQLKHILAVIVVTGISAQTFTCQCRIMIMGWLSDALADCGQVRVDLTTDSRPQELPCEKMRLMGLTGSIAVQSYSI